MTIQLDSAVLRKPEPSDVDALYQYRNDADVVRWLGGFSTGYSRADLQAWVETHRTRKDEALYVIADAATDRCLGHIGLYNIDHRCGTAELAILIGSSEHRGKGLGKQATAALIGYGFNELNLHRISLEVLETNTRAIALYQRLGFQTEGRLREAVFRSGRHLNLLLMGLLRGEYKEVFSHDHS